MYRADRGDHVGPRVDPEGDAQELLEGVAVVPQAAVVGQRGAEFVDDEDGLLASVLRRGRDGAGDAAEELVAQRGQSRIVVRRAAGHGPRQEVEALWCVATRRLATLRGILGVHASCGRGEVVIERLTEALVGLGFDTDAGRSTTGGGEEQKIVVATAARQ